VEAFAPDLHEPIEGAAAVLSILVRGARMIASPLVLWHHFHIALVGGSILSVIYLLLPAT